MRRTLLPVSVLALLLWSTDVTRAQQDPEAAPTEQAAEAPEQPDEPDAATPEQSAEEPEQQDEPDAATPEPAAEGAEQPDEPDAATPEATAEPADQDGPQAEEPAQAEEAPEAQETESGPQATDTPGDGETTDAPAAPEATDAPEPAAAAAPETPAPAGVIDDIPEQTRDGLKLLDEPQTTPPQVMSDGMLEEHNKARAAVGVGPLNWSPKLASVAQDWAEKMSKDGCKISHRQGSPYGENTFGGSAWAWEKYRRQVVYPPQKVTAGWAAEAADYNAKSHECTATGGKACGHYTQVVWKNTKDVGCAMAVCPDKGQVWVCNYDPPGNVQGEKPY